MPTVIIVLYSQADEETAAVATIDDAFYAANAATIGTKALARGFGVETFVDGSDDAEGFRPQVGFKVGATLGGFDEWLSFVFDPAEVG